MLSPSVGSFGKNTSIVWIEFYQFKDELFYAILNDVTILDLKTYLLLTMAIKTIRLGISMIKVGHIHE